MFHVLVPLLRLARDTYYWNPTRLARIIWAVASNFRWQLHIFKLLASPSLKALVLIDPTILLAALMSQPGPRALRITTIFCDRSSLRVCFGR